MLISLLLTVTFNFIDLEHWRKGHVGRLFSFGEFQIFWEINRRKSHENFFSIAFPFNFIWNVRKMAEKKVCNKFNRKIKAFQGFQLHFRSENQTQMILCVSISLFQDSARKRHETNHDLNFNWRQRWFHESTEIRRFAYETVSNSLHLNLSHFSAFSHSIFFHFSFRKKSCEFPFEALRFSSDARKRKTWSKMFGEFQPMSEAIEINYIYLGSSSASISPEKFVVRVGGDTV